MHRPIAVVAGLCLVSCNILPDEPPPAELQARADVVAAKVARIRDLSLEKVVPAAPQGKDELHEIFQAEIDEEWETSGAGMERSMKAFGLIPAGLDLKPFLGEFLRESVGGYYDPEQERFFVIRDDDEVSDDLEEAADEGEEFVLAHELTHAIDDQHFGLDLIREERDFDDDEALAFSALVEGSAMEGGAEYMLDRGGVPISSAGPFISPLIGLFSGLDAAKVDEFTTEIDEDELDVLTDAPPIIKHSMIFPYFQGWAFTNRLRSEFGWAAVDGAYADPPESTEQILHPERYFDRRDRPVRVTLPPPPNGWTAVTDQTLGMFSLRILLGTQLDEEAIDVADAWDGDRYVLWETPGGDALGFVSVWDYEGGASDFEKTYRALLRHRVGEDGTWEVVRRDDVVAVVQGVPKGTAGDAVVHLLDGATLERAPDDQAPDRWYWKALRFPVALRSLDRAWETHLLGGLALDARFHDAGYRFSLLSRWALYSENNPDRTAFWTALGLIGFTRDRTIDYTFARIPFAFYWHGRGDGEDRRAQWSLGPFDLIEYENDLGAKEFDLIWGWLLRTRWGDKARDGQRVRVLFVPIPGI